MNVYIVVAYIAELNKPAKQFMNTFIAESTEDANAQAYNYFIGRFGEVPEGQKFLLKVTEQ